MEKGAARPRRKIWGKSQQEPEGGATKNAQAFLVKPSYSTKRKKGVHGEGDTKMIAENRQSWASQEWSQRKTVMLGAGADAREKRKHHGQGKNTKGATVNKHRSTRSRSEKEENRVPVQGKKRNSQWQGEKTPD